MSGFRPTTHAMRGILVIGGGLVTVAAIQLFGLSTATDRFFAWTIQPSLSAAFLGGFYGSAAVIALLSARERQWARASIAVPGVIVFVWLTLAATLLHLDVLHLDSGGVFARLAAWAWLTIYVVEPPVLTVVYLHQQRQPGTDWAGGQALPRRLRVALGIGGAAAVATGASLFVAPGWMASGWPWPTTPLAARAIGAWFVAFGLMLAAMARTRESGRARAALVGTAAAGGLLLLAVARFAGTLEWTRPAAWLLVVYLAGLVVAGFYGWTVSGEGTAAQPVPQQSGQREGANHR